MRPVRLEFQAFGSYPGTEVVDFDVLGRRGLFLVTGPTGSGKTTVFDAMVFALYGVLPGARGSNKLADCRSHFAPADVETSVTFTFEVDGLRYTVRRTPAQMRPKLRGTGTTEVAASATLVCHRPGGDETLATRASDAAQVCTDVLGIDAGQFQRVVLLPQGKFADFLSAGDDDREKLLRPLFGTDLYKRATEWLLETVKRLRTEVQAVEQRVAHQRATAVTQLSIARQTLLDDDEAIDPETTDDDLRSMITALGPEFERSRDVLGGLESARQRATEARSEAAATAQRVDDAARHVAALERLEAERDDVHSGGRLAEASKRARPVVAAADAVRTASVRVDAARAAVAAAEATVRRDVERLGVAMPPFDPAAVAAAVQAVLHEVDAQRQQLSAAQEAAHEAATAAADLDAATASLAAAAAALDDIVRTADGLQARITELEPEAARLDTTEHDLRSAESLQAVHRVLVDEQRQFAEAVATEVAARHALDDVMRQFVATQAPLLAESLVSGEPCAVCGSTEHPAPARHQGDTVVGHAQVQAAQRRHAEAGAEMARLAGLVEERRSQLGDAADRSAEHFEQLVGAARTARDAARSAADLLARTKTEQATLATQTVTARAGVDEARTAVDRLTGLSTGRRAEADRLAAVVASIDPDRVEQRAAIAAELVSVAAGLGAVFSEVALAEGALGSANDTLATALGTSGLESPEVAHAALLPEVDEQRLEAALVAWTTAHIESSSSLATLRQQGVPEKRPDVDALERVETEAAEAANVAQQRCTTAANALGAATTALDQVVSVTSGAADLQRRYDTARVVHRTCNGEGTFKVRIERWVLAAELARVTEAANVHLGRMTSHRFALRSDDVKGGLGLVVFDSHSGTTRATASLSGGEQFQASLALALGLADVVSMGGSGSGRTFEALFVDEGFGSLDPTALDQAIDALAQLQATGRMVGAITHVEAMKQSLHVGIEVRRLPDGGGSTLVVHP